MARADALGIERDNLLLDARHIGLILLDDERVKLSLPITWHSNFLLAIFARNGLAAWCRCEN